MLSNYLKIAWRNLAKNKVSSLINIVGLTVGLSACLLIGLYLQHESSFDTFQSKGNRIARVIMEYSFSGSPEAKRDNFTSTKVGPVFTRTFPEVESAVRMTSRDRVVRYQNKLVTEHNFMFADSTFFGVFDARFRLGNPRNALSGPYKVVLTESAAQKYFGADNPMGKILLVGPDNTAYQVTGVMADYPPNSQIKFDFLASFSSLGVNQEETYFEANYTTYLLLKDDHSLAALQAKITPFMKKEMAGSEASINFLPEPFLTVHLHSDYEGFVPNTSITYLYILLAVGLLILVIVCFTYINLNTAQSMQRAREVGVRKVAGARKPQLFWQFMSESGLLCLTALLLSVVVAVVALPFFNNLTDRQLPIRALLAPSFIGFSGLITLVVSLLAGSYPALVLSGFQPVTVLKGIFKNTNSGKWLQRSLTVFQFVISIALIAATFIIQKQLYFIQHKKLGYDRNHILVLPMSQKMNDNLSVIKQELKANPDIISVSRCVSTPVSIGGGYNMRSSTMPDKEQIAVTANPIDEDYIKTTGLQLVAGQDLTEQDINEVDARKQREPVYHFILNESAARQLGWTPEQAIGKKMFLDASRPGLVKGVIRDFHFESLQTAIKPLVLFPGLRGNQLLLKVSGQHLPETISFAEAKWKQLVFYMPFEYRFLDDDYTKLYRSEHQLGNVMNLFAGIAILLACFGLFGLSSYAVQQRTKEIGVRKVLGASVLNLWGLLSKDFVVLVLIAFLIATPIAYYFLTNWLQQYEYRTEISWWIFAVSGAGALVITLLTVSFQSVKAALMNPVTSLRSE